MNPNQTPRTTVTTRDLARSLLAPRDPRVLRNEMNRPPVPPAGTSVATITANQTQSPQIPPQAQQINAQLGVIVSSLNEINEKQMGIMNSHNILLANQEKSGEAQNLLIGQMEKSFKNCLGDIHDLDGCQRSLQELQTSLVENQGKIQERQDRIVAGQEKIHSEQMAIVEREEIWMKKSRVFLSNITSKLSVYKSANPWVIHLIKMRGWTY